MPCAWIAYKELILVKDLSMILSSAVDIVSEVIGFVADILNQAGIQVSSK